MKTARESKRRRGIPVSGTSRPGWRRHAPLPALLALTVLAWSNSFQSGLVGDNKVLIGKDVRITAATAHNLHLILTQDYWSDFNVSGLWRPLTTLSYLFNYAVLDNAGRVAGYHWVNLALHLANVALVYALALVVVGETGPALAICALWGLHPVLTESVTNIVGRADLLSAFGVLAGLFCHVKAARAAGSCRLRWLFALMIAAGVAFFSKESGVVLVAILLIYDAGLGTGVAWRARLSGYLALLPPLLIFFYFRAQVFSRLPAVHFPFVDNPLLGAGFWTARLTAIRIVVKYLTLLAWPARQSNDYSFNQVPPAGWSGLAALAACLAAAAFAAVCYRRRPPLFFFIAFFFVALAPTSNVFLLIGTVMAERFLYLPSIGFAGCLALAAFAAGRRLARPWIAPMAIAAICAGFAVRTYVRNMDWQDERSLWTSAVQAAPASAKTHLALASALADSGPEGLHRALAESATTLAILDPLRDEQNSPAPYIDAASYAGLQAEQSGADSHALYQHALELLLRARRIETANNQENRRLDLRRGKPSATVTMYELYLQLGAVYLRLNDPPRALEALDYGLRHRPAPGLFEQMSVAYFTMGDLHRAAITLIEGVTVFPAHARFVPALAQLYQRIDPGGCAIRNASGALSLNLECPQVHADVCAAARGVDRLYRQMEPPGAPPPALADCQ